MQVNFEIKKYLKDHGISQKHISRIANIPPDKLCSSLNGKRKLSLKEYAHICGALCVNTDYFLKPSIPGREEESWES